MLQYYFFSGRKGFLCFREFCSEWAENWFYVVILKKYVWRGNKINWKLFYRLARWRFQSEFFGFLAKGLRKLKIHV